jgi:hypothetical protein
MDLHQLIGCTGGHVLSGERFLLEHSVLTGSHAVGPGQLLAVFAANRCFESLEAVAIRLRISSSVILAIS